jgi:hypothetical protein
LPGLKAQVPASLGHDLTVSFDIFIQAFSGGQAASGRPAAARRTLTPFLTAAPDNGYALVRTADGEADVYGLDGDSLMINHASGRQIWQLMVDLARAGGYVIMPIGCPTCVLDPAHVTELPVQLQDTVVVIATGEDLRRVVETS